MADQSTVVNAFISYSHQDRKWASQTKRELRKVGIEAFLAHEDIRVSEEWQQRIIQELGRCDLFVPLLSVNFVRSEWAPQEAGFIASRPEVIIAPLSIDKTDPFGFFAKVQSGRIGSDGVTYDLLVEPLFERLTETVPRKILPTLIRRAANAGTFRHAEFLMTPLVPLFPFLTAREAQTLAEASAKNGQIWSASKCRTEYLPEFIREHENTIEPETLRILQYQIEKNKRYIPGPDELAGREGDG